MWLVLFVEEMVREVVLWVILNAQNAQVVSCTFTLKKIHYRLCEFYLIKKTHTHNVTNQINSNSLDGMRCEGRVKRLALKTNTNLRSPESALEPASTRVARALLVAWQHCASLRPWR